VHDPAYVDMIEAFCSMGGGALDMDTIVSAESWDAALTAAGGVLATIDEMEGRSDSAGFVLARPPGHHALADRAMGFCIFNNVAIGAASLRRRGRRVAVLDWDVHHGNGTQALLGDDDGVLYVSIHQSPFYPFAGDVSSFAEGPAPGTNLNIPLPEGTAGDVYRDAWASVVIPTLVRFDPDWVLVSAGYDAHYLDHLAGMRLIEDDYGWMASHLADVFPRNRVLFVLEGGYDLDALRSAARATVMGLSGSFEPAEPFQSPPSAAEALTRAMAELSPPSHS
jgi:acetoin utilization deacetylase AcuC-like enzyme